MSEPSPSPTVPPAASSTVPALELRGVHKVFRGDLGKRQQVAIDRLTIRFQKGQCTGLLGHNGAGKTTTIRLVLGLVKPDDGEIRVFGGPLTRAAKERIGYMPESNKMPQALTPEEILHHQLKLFRPTRARNKDARRQLVASKLAEVGLADHRSKRVSRLSKGMARRLAWAQATIHEPELLILDEPSSGLDPLGRLHMLKWIEKEKDKGTSIVLCTHELAQVHSVCEHFHILNRGRLVLTTDDDGPPIGPAADRTLLKTRHGYNVHVSGADAETLQKIGEEAGLLPWLDYRQEGYLGILGFADYEGAISWVTALLKRGLVVVRFGDETFVGEEELLPYFDGETPT